MATKDGWIGAARALRSCRDVVPLAFAILFGRQLSNAMGEKMVKLTDLFRLWDEDDSGLISRKEFRKAMAFHGALVL